MELPAGFADRVGRLRDPQRFVADTVAALEHAERLDADEARSEAPRAIWDSLPPGMRRQYLRIVNPPLEKVIAWQPSPEQQALKRRIEERFRWLNSDDPAAVERRNEHRRELDRRSAEFAEEQLVKQAEIEARLRNAGLPVIPELIDWLSGCPNLHTRPRNARHGPDARWSERPGENAG
ncbi:hypothetical protein [Micromonospora sp. AB353]|uniref:hypothetical protein n=1 Tax=Micromonospora sp. AB353 TaxID=3413282 RepID=UPI003C1D5430